MRVGGLIAPVVPVAPRSIASLYRPYYPVVMDTISLKLPKLLLEQLAAEADARGTSKSAVVRDCLTNTLRKRRGERTPTCLDLMGDLFGSQPGPRDASTNKRYLKGFGRGREGSR
jgi:hypothetical protein